MSIACWRWSNHIFILDLTPAFNELDKDKCKASRGTFKFWNLVPLKLEVWWYFAYKIRRFIVFGLIFGQVSGM